MRLTLRQASSQRHVRSWVTAFNHRVYIMITFCGQNTHINIPVGDDAWIIAGLIFINTALALVDERLLLAVGAYSDRTLDGLAKVWVDWRATHWLEALQLARGGHIEALYRGGAIRGELISIWLIDSWWTCVIFKFENNIIINLT